LVDHHVPLVMGMVMLIVTKMFSELD
jgi:hypothetical protein